MKRLILILILAAAALTRAGTVHAQVTSHGNATLTSSQNPSAVGQFVTFTGCGFRAGQELRGGINGNTDDPLIVDSAGCVGFSFTFSYAGGFMAYVDGIKQNGQRQLLVWLYQNVA